jgi:DNA replication and repair protein RecF
MVQYGVRVMALREAAVLALQPGAISAYEAIVDVSSSLRMAYSASAPLETSAYLHALVRSRNMDARRGSPSVGPHRDDVSLGIGQLAMRGIASQGQHRAVSLALKLAERDAIGEARGVRPILLLDDVSSELDRSRTAHLLRYLIGRGGQIFLSTTRPEWIAEVASQPALRGFAVDAGVVVPVYL